jgi:glycolate dehydrogenase iron-sulfur subunit
MRTNFGAEQLHDPHMRDAERALRTCVHCGFCIANCPTYVLLGDERDGPRGRIMLMQQMLESDAAPTAETVTHLDRCLSCLGCRTACPSGVDYAALIDKSRAYIEQRYRRPIADRLFRAFILFVLTRPMLFTALSRISRAFAPVISRLPGKLGAMAQKARTKVKIPIPCHGPPQRAIQASIGLNGSRTLADWMASPRKRGSSRAMTLWVRSRPISSIHPSSSRVLLLPGCVQRVLAPEIDAAAVRVLARDNMHVERLNRTACCGALAYHLGKTDIGKDCARGMIRAFEEANAKGQIEAVLITASGCSAFLKDYRTVFADEPEWKPRAEAFAAKVKDFVELANSPANAQIANAPLVAYHPPCSLQHGQRIHGLGEALLARAGFRLAAIPDAHLCCGSAGTYSLLQPEIAGQLRAKKLADVRSTGAAAIASDNIGCLTHLAGEIPAVHIAQLLDWAAGGPKPL